MSHESQGVGESAGDAPEVAPRNVSGVVRLIAFTSLCSVLAPLNSTMIAVALPQIGQDFALSRSTAAWLISAYLIAMAVAQPVAGRLGDQIGRGRVVRVGLLCFIGISVAAAFAPNFVSLIILRVAQAAVAAGLIPNAIALIRERVPSHRLGRLNGLNAAAIAAAAGVGPLLGSAALLAGSWRLIFAASLPFAVGALILLPRLRLRDRPRPDHARTDWSGPVHYALLLIAATALLTRIGATSRSAWDIVAWIGLVVGIAAFVWRQRVTPAPVAAWGLFRIRSFAAASMQVLLTNLAMYTTLLMVPFLMIDVLGGTESSSGPLLGVMALFMGLASPAGGRLSDWRGRRLAAQLGAGLVVLASLLLIVALQVGLTTAGLAVLLALFGAGVGIASGAASTAAVEAAPRSVAGTAAGTSSMMRYVGSIIGTGILGASLGASEALPSTYIVLQATILVTAFAAMAAATLIHAFPPEEPDDELLEVTLRAGFRASSG